jgi:rubrerythrin
MASHEPQERKPEEEILEDLLCNRTGLMTHPELSAELIEAAKNTVPTTQGNGEQIAMSRADYANEALPIGSPPLSCVEVSEEDQENEESLAMDSEGMVVLLDKLGERLAFERQGTRLYQAFLQKFETLAEDDELGPSSEEIKHICEQELEHFKLLQKAIVQLGGDATVESPSADIAGLLSQGALQVVSDPRTTIPQSLQALLTAELADNDGWELLQQVAAEVGEKDLEKQCRKAFEHEQEHLDKVRGWVLEMTIEEAAGVVVESDETDEVEEVQEEKPRKKTSAKRSSSSTNKGSKRKKK